MGYYSPESLEYTAKEELDAYIPDNQPKNNKSDGFEYRPESDDYICPAGKVLTFQRERVHRNILYRIYRCYKCSGCERMGECHGKSSRYKELWKRVQDGLHRAMAEKIRSKEGRIYAQRKQIVEPVFGNIKWNKGIRRLLLRGLEGAKIEYLLGCIGHNLDKIGSQWAECRTLATTT